MTQDFAKKKSTSQKSAPKKKTATTTKTRSNTRTPSKVTNKTNPKRKTNTRKKSPKPTSSTKKAPLWLWFIVIGGVVGFVIFLNHLSDSRATQQAEVVPGDANNSRTSKTSHKERSAVKLDFYEILKEHEVEVSDKVIAATPVADNIHYYLQAGSFRHTSDADTLRAKLILLGLPAKVETSNKQANTSWYRVIAGPFETRSKLAKARSILASEQISSLLIKRKIDP